MNLLGKLLIFMIGVSQIFIIIMLLIILKIDWVLNKIKNNKFLMKIIKPIIEGVNITIIANITQFVDITNLPT
jgi:hypothetical protein